MKLWKLNNKKKTLTRREMVAKMDVEEDRSIYFEDLSEEEKHGGMDLPMNTRILKIEG